MAFVATDPAFVLNVTIYASNARKIVKPYNLTAATHADALTDSTTIITALNKVQAGNVSSYSVSTRLENDAFTIPTSDDAEWGESAIVSGKILDKPLKAVSVTIPFPKITIFEDTTGKGRDIIDVDFSNETTTHLSEYLDLFRTGGQATVSDGEILETSGAGLEGRRL